MELDYKTKQGQTLFDVSNITLYGMDNIVLGLLKPSGKSLIDELTIDTLIYDTDYTQDSTVQLELTPQEEITEYIVKGQEAQSIFDLCIMNYGNLDKLLTMIQDNANLVSINDVDVSMKDVIFNTNKLVEAYVPSIIAKKRYSFATMVKDTNSYLLQENGFFLLLESGDKILL